MKEEGIKHYCERCNKPMDYGGCFCVKCEEDLGKLGDDLRFLLKKNDWDNLSQL